MASLGYCPRAAPARPNSSTPVRPRRLGSIAAWWRAAKAQYQHTADPREVSEAGGRITVLAEVRGTFPGSPAMLSFIFTLKNNEIAALEIGA